MDLGDPLPQVPPTVLGIRPNSLDTTAAPRRFESCEPALPLDIVVRAPVQRAGKEGPPVFDPARALRFRAAMRPSRSTTWPRLLLHLRIALANLRFLVLRPFFLDRSA